MKTKAFTIFHSLLKDEVIIAFLNLIESIEKNQDNKIEKYSIFVRRLFEKNENFSDYLWQLITLDENIYVRKQASKEYLSDMLMKCVTYELQTLQEISRVTSEEIKNELKENVFLPDWTTDTTLDFTKMYQERISQLFTVGYGIYVYNKMFMYHNGEIIPVKYPDPIQLQNLTGYERERQVIIDNTIAFIDNKPAANTLLYGDAGTGKSSTVKAIVNRFADKGLRMIEVRKKDLLEIPYLIEQLANNPLKFILFIDDLSFSKSNEEIGALKAILEGSVSAKTDNIVVYVTSNRRHLIKETFSERAGDDIHINETIQEQTSLSHRFGLSVLFSKPTKAEYLKIVYDLCDSYEIVRPDNLDILAERHAMSRGGRSGRTARQFVDSLKSMQ